jgi:hypothetical protein
VRPARALDLGTGGGHVAYLMARHRLGHGLRFVARDAGGGGGSGKRQRLDQRRGGRGFR